MKTKIFRNPIQVKKKGVVFLPTVLPSSKMGMKDYFLASFFIICYLHFYQTLSCRSKQIFIFLIKSNRYQIGMYACKIVKKKKLSFFYYFLSFSFFSFSMGKIVVFLVTVTQQLNGYYGSWCW